MEVGSANAENLLVEARHSAGLSQDEPTRRGHITARGRTVTVPSALPRLPLEQALATVVLPVHVNWSSPGRRFDLCDRSQRSRVYEIVLREGTPEDILTYLDGALLADLWNDLVIPQDIRDAWAPLLAATVRADDGAVGGAHD